MAAFPPLYVSPHSTRVRCAGLPLYCHARSECLSFFRLNEDAPPRQVPRHPNPSILFSIWIEFKAFQDRSLSPLMGQLFFPSAGPAGFGSLLPLLSQCESPLSLFFWQLRVTVPSPVFFSLNRNAPNCQPVFFPLLRIAKGGQSFVRSP